MVSSAAQYKMNRLQEVIDTLETQKQRLQELSWEVSTINSAGEKVWSGNVHDDYENAVTTVANDIANSINSIIAAQNYYNNAIDAFRYS